MAWPRGTIRGVFWYWSRIRVRKSGLRPYFLDKQGPARPSVWDSYETRGKTDGRNILKSWQLVSYFWFRVSVCFGVQKVTAGRIGMECLILSWVIWLTCFCSTFMLLKYGQFWESVNKSVKLQILRLNEEEYQRDSFWPFRALFREVSGEGGALHHTMFLI